MIIMHSSRKFLYSYSCGSIQNLVRGYEICLKITVSSKQKADSKGSKHVQEHYHPMKARDREDKDQTITCRLASLGYDQLLVTARPFYLRGFGIWAVLSALRLMFTP